MIEMIDLNTINAVGTVAFLGVTVLFFWFLSKM
jgi:hypothetical protein